MQPLTYYCRRCDMTGDTWIVWCDIYGVVVSQKTRRAGVGYKLADLKREGYTQVVAPDEPYSDREPY